MGRRVDPVPGTETVQCCSVNCATTLLQVCKSLVTDRQDRPSFSIFSTARSRLSILNLFLFCIKNTPNVVSNFWGAVQFSGLSFF